MPGARCGWTRPPWRRASKQVEFLQEFSCGRPPTGPLISLPSHWVEHDCNMRFSAGLESCVGSARVLLPMNIFLVMVFCCIGGGIYAIVQRSLPISPRRKVIDMPAKWIGISLVVLPFANAAIILGSRLIATQYFSASRTIDHWSVMGPLILFPLSIAGLLTVAKRWSVPKQYDGGWSDYTPHQVQPRRPDFSFLESSNKNEGNDSYDVNL